MNTYKPTSRRNDPAPGPEEIEISPGGLAQAPRRVLKENAVTALCDIHAAANKFEQVAAETQMRLAQLRLAANELQFEYESLIEERDGLVQNIGVAESELAVSKSRMLELDSYVRKNWNREPMVEQMAEHDRRAFLADPARLPTWILEYNVALGVMNERITAFEKLHGCGEK